MKFRSLMSPPEILFSSVWHWDLPRPLVPTTFFWESTLLTIVTTLIAARSSLPVFEKLANLATAAGVKKKGKFRIHAPLIQMSKAEIITTGLSLGVDYSITNSCYDPSPQGEACGRCDACHLRIRGFQENKLKDPALYSSNTST